MTRFSWLEYRKAMGCHFSEEIIEDCGSCLAGILSLQGSLRARALMEKAPWQGTEGGPWPTVREELRLSVQELWRNRILPTTTWVSMEADPAPTEFSDETAANTSTAALWSLLKQRTQGSHCQVPDPRKLSVVNMCRLKPLTFGITCYTAMHN